MTGYSRNHRKKLIVFYSKGGGGHIAATEAIRGYFNGGHQITPVNIITDILAALDPVQLMSRGCFSGEDIYNFLQARGWYGLINLYALKFGAPCIAGSSQRIKRLVKGYLERERPDLLISVIPFFNAAIAEATGELGIPFVIVSTDLDSATYIYGMEQERHDHLFLCLPHDSAAIRATIEPAGLNSQQILITGFPVRPSFIAPIDPERVKKEFDLCNDKPTILLLMGAAGANKTLSFAREIEKTDHPIQLLICTGRNRNLHERLCLLPAPPHITRRIIGYTPKIADLMEVSDLIVTKAGPNTIFEAIHRELPMVIDATTTPVHWEKMNISFVEEHGLGTVIRKPGELPHTIAQHLYDDVHRARVRNRFEAFAKKIFREEFKILVSEILTEQREDNALEL